MQRKNFFDVLTERGFIKQSTDTKALKSLLGKEKVTSYTGYDSTFKSLTIGHLLPIMAQAHMQKAGHRAIVVIGGATTMIGDPSGRTKTRPMLTKKQVKENARPLKKQFAKILTFHNESNKASWKEGAFMLNNADWLTQLNLIEFLRDIGVHFNVSRMIATKVYEGRMERGLSFLEFSYMPLQAYDFLVLFRKYDCKLQMGGDDQWGNILAGVDLIRRVEGATVHALTFPLIETATGEKMGKTAAGAIFLDPKITSPYDFYQFWINVDDRDVERFLRLFTFLPMEEIRKLGQLRGADIRQAKEFLAYEVTKIVHGKSAAEKAKGAARAVFGGEDEAVGVPTLEISAAKVGQGIPLVNLFAQVKLAGSKSAARRLIEQGGAYLNGKVIKDVNSVLTIKDFKGGKVMLRAGKKHFYCLKLIK